MCFWRITGGATGIFLHHHVEQRAARHRDARQARLPHRRRSADDTERVGARRRARPTSRPARSGTATRCSSATTSTANAGSSTSSRPRATTCGGGLMSRPDWRLAVDIGGTFTDLVLLDAASGTVVVDKTLTTPSAPLDGVRRGVGRAARQGGRAPGRHHGADRARHDADHQRADRGQDRPGRPRHHRRVRRHAAHPRRAPLRHVRPADRVPGAADPPRPHVRDRRAGQRRRRGASLEPGRGRPRRARRRARRRQARSRSRSASSTATSTPPTSASSPTTCAPSSACRCASPARCRRRSASTRGWSPPPATRPRCR